MRYNRTVCAAIKMGALAIIVGSVYLLNGCVSVPPIKPPRLVKGDYQYLAQYMDWMIPQEMDEYDIEGLSIVIADKESIIYTKGFGRKDYQGNPVTPDIRFSQGSITKLFTAIAVMQLVEQGEFNLDTPVKKLLPDLDLKSVETGWNQVTVRTLLNHHSGFPSDIFNGFSIGYPTNERLEPQPLSEITVQLSKSYLTSKPGMLHSYSNIGYAILGRIIEVTSKQSYSEYIKTHIFQPAGMEESTVEAYVKPGTMSYGFVDGDVVSMPVIRDYPAGSLVASANDMGKFMNAILSGGKGIHGQIISKKTLDTMLAPSNTDSTLDGLFRIGLGFFYSKLSGDMESMVGHGGDLPPFHALLFFDVKTGIGVSVQVNSIQGSSFQLKDIVSNAMAMAIEAKTGIKPSLEKEERNPARTLNLSEWDGEYAGNMGISSFRMDDGKPEMKLMGIPAALHLESDGTYSISINVFGLFEIKPDSLKDLRINFVKYNNDPYILVSAYEFPLMVMEPFNKYSIPEVWKQRCGDYEMVHSDPFPVLESRFSLICDDDEGALFFELTLGNVLGGSSLAIPLKIHDDIILQTAGRGRNGSESIYVIKEDGEEYLSFSGYKLKKM